MRRPSQYVEKVDVLCEETGKKSSMAATGVGDQASNEGLTEITSGKADFQQGLATTCKDLPTKGRP